MDTESLHLLEEGLRKTMAAASGQDLDAALADLGWLEMLDEMPDSAIRLVFRLLGETGAHAPVLNDVVLRAAGRAGGSTLPLPFTGSSWILWERTDQPTSALGGDLPIHRTAQGDSVPVAAGRHALGWWLVGASHAMLSLARQHALDRVQFGRPIAEFQAIRCRLPPDGMRSDGGWWVPGAQCCRWRASMLWTAASLVDPSRRFRRSGTGWQRPWSASKARRRPWWPPRLSRTI